VVCWRWAIGLSHRGWSHNRCRAWSWRSGGMSRRSPKHGDAQEGEECDEREGPGSDPHNESVPGRRRRGASREGALHRRPLTGVMAPVSGSPITWELRGYYGGITCRLRGSSPGITRRWALPRSRSELLGDYLRSRQRPAVFSRGVHPQGGGAGPWWNPNHPEIVSLCRLGLPQYPWDTNVGRHYQD
jgi:hypothetical protein